MVNSTNDAMAVITRAQARELDRRAASECAVPTLLLMENAGRGATDFLEALGIAGPVVVVCGSGNNGGDGFVIARHLFARGVAVTILLCADPAKLQGDAALNYHAAVGCRVPITIQLIEQDPAAWDTLLAGSSWIVDALLGTGAQGPPRPIYAQAIEAINRSSARKLAIDLPSGLDSDTGQPSEPTVRATYTATFVGLKRGFLEPAAEPFLGQIAVIDLGLPSWLIDSVLKPPAPESK